MLKKTRFAIPFPVRFAFLMFSVALLFQRPPGRP
jgi:hypothetical protein